MKYTVDDRISEGVYAAKALSLFRDYIQHPKNLAEPPELSQETMDELSLVDMGKPVE
jgi:hypothetical protein